MGIDIPAAAVASILSEQKAWKADRIKRSSATSLHKRCVFVVLFVNEMEYTTWYKMLGYNHNINNIWYNHNINNI